MRVSVIPGEGFQLECPAVVTPEKLAKDRQHLAAGLNVREVAARVKIGKTALYQALKAEKSSGSNVKPT